MFSVERLMLAISCSILLGNLVINANAQECTTINVHDGDTVRMSCDGEVVNCRLHGIDAPELKQEYGIAVREALKAQLMGKTEHVDIHGTDRYKRSICTIGNVNRAMVENGHAWAYEKYSKDYVEAQKTARLARLGLWAADGAIPPWKWRKMRK